PPTLSRPDLLHDLALSIHALVVLPELALLDGAPPGFVRAVPGDGLLDATLEGDLGPPARGTGQFCGVYCISPVVTQTVLDVADQRARAIEQPQDVLRHGEHVELAPAPDVERLALHAGLLEEREQRVAVVEHVQPVAPV